MKNYKKSDRERERIKEQEPFEGRKRKLFIDCIWDMKVLRNSDRKVVFYIFYVLINIYLIVKNCGFNEIKNVFILFVD